MGMRWNRQLGSMQTPVRRVSHPVYPQSAPLRLRSCFYCGRGGEITRVLGFNVCRGCLDLPALDYDRV
jgi:ribosomal protein S14